MKISVSLHRQLKNMMIKKFLWLSLMALLLTNCENPVIDDNEDPEEPQGNLKVSIYQIGSTPFSALTRSVDNCSRINYAIYTTEGKRVKQVNQESSAAGFGSAVFQLEPDTYQLVIVGHSSNGNPTMTDPTKIQFKNNQGFTDTFLHSQSVVVTEEGQDLTVELKRITALCRIVLTDDIPEDVAKLRFQYKGGSGAFDANTGLGCVNSIQTVELDVAPGQKEFDLYTFLHDIEGTIQLQVTAYDEDENVICDRSFSIPMVQNQVTWFSGPFFTGGTGSTGVTIVINTDWAGETHITF